MRVRTAFLVAAVVGIPGLAAAQTPGTCEPGTATVDLDGNNVRARLYNTGGLFWNGSGNVYTVPRDGQVNAIFASNIWIGGLDEGGAIRFAGTAYGPFEFWPGPLDDAGSPPNPADCSAYDRIYRVSRVDLETFDAGGSATADMTDWPWQLGAPVHDGDGNPDNYDLAAGDRPGLIGEQTAWWVMNDVGNVKGWSAKAPIGLEVQVTAFAYHTSDDLDNATFYRYRLVHKGSQTLSRTWFGIHSDPDLGNSSDDFVGSDSTIGLGYVYNGDTDDEGPLGYGIPPALGYAFVQGPLVPDPDGGTWIDGYGTEHPGMMRRKMTNFVKFNSSAGIEGAPTGSTDDPYQYLQSLWRDGSPMTIGNVGVGGQIPTTFLYPGDPVTHAYWSMVNLDGSGDRHPPHDVRFILSTGPFDLDPGDTQDIVVAIVWAQGKDYLDSVVELKEAACVAQHAVNEHVPCEYVRPVIPLGNPVVLLSPANGVTGQPVNVTVSWESVPFAYAYEVSVASNPGFEGGTAFTTARPDTSVSLQLDADTPYWWRVRARFPGDLAGPWAEVGTFSTGDASLFPQVPYAAADYITSFQVVANAAGPLDPPEQGAFAFEDNGFPLLDGADRPTSRQQVGDGIWGMHTGEGNGPTFDDFGRRSLRNGSRDVVPWDWEIRFTERCRAAWEADQANPYGAFPTDACYAYDRFAVTTDAGDSPMIVPFEVWNTGIGTPDDPSDDFRMVLVGIDWDGDGWNLQCYDHEVSGGDNDPSTDWIYTYLPQETAMSPGEVGYEVWKAALLSGAGADRHGREVMARLVFVNWNGGDVSTCDPRPTFTSEMPEVGTAFRIETGKPIVPILAAPGPGSVRPAGVHRFFWSADSFDPVSVEIRSSEGFSLDIEPARSGESVTITEPGSYTWRAVSSWAGPSAWWPFEVVSTVAAEDEPDLPTSVELHPNYPNPFNPSTVIRFGLPEATGVTLEVFDVLGRRVMTVLSDTPYAAGYHDVALQMGGLASGTYLYRLQAGPVVRHAKMVYVR